jgi:iron complex outermembrane receptor protein
MGPVAALLVCLALTTASLPAATNAPTADLTRLSIEELMNVEVTSVSKKPEKLCAAPMAIITKKAKDTPGLRMLGGGRRRR